MATSAAVRETTTSIRVRVLLFASYAELLGRDALELSLPAPARVVDALDQLRRLPGGDHLPPSPLCAVNLSQALPDAQLLEADELAILPPLSGG
jgi:molybdopterin converting factor small subunit